MRSQKHALTALSFAAASLLAGRAQATLCTDGTTVKNPVYIVGSTAFKPVLLRIAAYLATQPTPVTIVYGGTGSCAGVASIIDAAAGVGGAIANPSGQTGYFTWFDSTGTQQSCDIFPASSDGGAPVYPDIALSDAFASSCQSLSQTLPSLGIDENLGPVQAMAFAVPQNSNAKSISGDAAWFVYGFGAVNGTANQVTPWTDLDSIYQRGSTSGTQAMISQAIGLSSTRWYGVTPSFSGVSGTQAMIQALTNAATAQNGNAIGIVGAADIDPVRRMGTTSIRLLAYKHTGQNCGYLPDSDPTTYDKRNVRDGHYAIWGPLHVFTWGSSSVDAASVRTYITGFQQLGSTDVIAAEAQAGLVPQCAMRVTRSTEIGDLTANTSNTAPCGCYYEQSASVDGTTTCSKCNVSTDCPNNYTCQKYGMAMQGYCEPPI